MILGRGRKSRLRRRLRRRLRGLVIRISRQLIPIRIRRLGQTLRRRRGRAIPNSSSCRLPLNEPCNASD
jgi:hypothetical protein